jgi:hypothetical protein
VVVVELTPPVMVLRRLAAGPCDAAFAVGAGVAVAAAVATVVAGAAGLSGAASFRTCVAANAVIDARDVNVTAVANDRRSSEDLTRGARAGIAGIRADTAKSALNPD